MGKVEVGVEEVGSGKLGEGEYVHPAKNFNTVWISNV